MWSPNATELTQQIRARAPIEHCFCFQGVSFLRRTMISAGSLRIDAGHEQLELAILC